MTVIELCFLVFCCIFGFVFGTSEEHIELVGAQYDQIEWPQYSYTVGFVFLNGQPICDNHMDYQLSQLVCRKLGFAEGFRGYDDDVESLDFQLDDNNFIISDVDCQGSESSIWDCQYKENYCSIDEALVSKCRGIQSFPNTTMEEYELLNGDWDGKGYVYLNGQPICNDAWGDEESNVVCKKLGFDFGRDQYGPWDVESWGENWILNFVNCSGDETSIWDCQYETAINICWGYGGAMVNCEYTAAPTNIQTTAPTNGEEYELVGGSDNTKGNVYLNGQPICDDNWDWDAADIFCRRLGFYYGNPIRGSYFGELDEDNFIMTDVDCSWIFEGSIWDCQYNTEINCGIAEGAGVECFGDTDNMEEYELVGGSASRGNVYLNGRPICMNGWDKNVASLVCRKLGFEYGEDIWYAVVDERNFIMDNVDCSGEENSIWDCEFTIPSSSCDVYQGAGVICHIDPGFHETDMGIAVICVSTIGICICCCIIFCCMRHCKSNEGETWTLESVNMTKMDVEKVQEGVVDQVQPNTTKNMSTVTGGMPSETSDPPPADWTAPHASFLPPPADDAPPPDYAPPAFSSDC